MNGFLLLILISLSICADEATFAEFQKFVLKYKKEYKTLEEYQHRYQVFCENYAKLQKMKEEKKYTTWEQGVTKVFDLTEEEFIHKYANFDLEAFKSFNIPRVKPEYRDVPESFDWREKGAVNPVRDQGECGSCWAFSVCQNLEGLYYIKNNRSLVCSVQNYIDCDIKLDGGCNGGNAMFALNFTLENGGVMAEDEYPYEGMDGECRQIPSKLHFQIKSWERLTEEEEDIRIKLVEMGPLSSAVNSKPLVYYTSGIIAMSDWDCGVISINHAVLIVGYGTENGLNYWIVKNTLGENWGEDGYFRIASNNTCGINMQVTTGIM